MNSIAGKRVLISPLDWGLGHAARCIPIIRNLLENSNEVFVYAPKHLQEYFAQRFPELNYIDDCNASFDYGVTGFSNSELIKAALKLRKQIKQEHKICTELCYKLNPDFIISDNRYGFFNSKTRSILITHQLRPIIPPPLGIFNKWVYNFLDRYHNSFNEIWVPDFPNKPGLAGELSHPTKSIKKVRYIGLLSRFGLMPRQNHEIEPNSILIITSGPENHRREMAQLLSNTLQYEAKLIIVGIENAIADSSHIIFKKSPSDHELMKFILESEIIVSCFGYSTLMDLISLQRSAILVPTPGQTEQEYLAKIDDHLMVLAKQWSEIEILLKNKKNLIENLSKKQENIQTLIQLKIEKK